MSILVGYYIRNLETIKELGKIESDEYNNAILIEKVILDLYRDSYITEFEATVIKGVYLGYTYSELAEKLQCGRRRVSTTFTDVCNRVAFILGNEFTDAGFLDEYKNHLYRFRHLDSDAYFEKSLKKLRKYDTEMHT